MKLKNKKTGEIVTADLIYANADNCVSSNYSLAELNEEWEDYKEPKDIYWCMDDCGFIEECKEEWAPTDRFREEIGNYFGTKEEAEKAVEKLKAWKRLKDKDFQFHGHNALGVGEITFSLDFEDMDDEGEIGQLRHDLDLLFGGEK